MKSISFSIRLKVIILFSKFNEVVCFHLLKLKLLIRSNKSSSRQESSKVLDPQKNTSPKRCRVKVLYDYDATSPSELSLVADEVSHGRNFEVLLAPV